MVPPLSRVELGQDFSKNGALCKLENKINEIVDRLNYLTDPRTPPHLPPRFKGRDE